MWRGLCRAHAGPCMCARPPVLCALRSGAAPPHTHTCLRGLSILMRGEGEWEDFHPVPPRPPETFIRTIKTMS